MAHPSPSLAGFRPAITRRGWASAFHGPPLVVVKVGGAVATMAGALEAVAAALEGGRARRRLLVVPGGGAFADAVRTRQHASAVDDTTAHWQALSAMDQYGWEVAARLGAPVAEAYGDIGTALADRGVAVLLPARWMREADTLPVGWEVTSDSIAAFVAGALDAERLLLVKARPGGRELLDAAFDRVAPVGLPWACVTPDALLAALAAATSD